MKKNIKNIKKLNYFVIAELGMNHDGSFGNAIRLIDEAKRARVDAVKFQFHISEEETLPSAPPPPYFTIEGRSDYFKRTSFSLSQWVKLKKYCHLNSIPFIVSPFSIKAAKLLYEKIGIDAYKIASGEVTNHPLLTYIRKTNIPVFLSSGMSDFEEIDNAVSILNDNLLVLFQCSSQYPCQAESVGLNVVEEMKNKYPNLAIGFSDHTPDNVAAIAAFCKGATVFEKHFTLSKNMYGPDAQLSLTPQEMRGYVEGISFVAKALANKVNKSDLGKYKDMKLIFEKSIVASKNLQKGRVLKLKDLNFKKPGNGIRADEYKKIIGKKLKKSKKIEDQILLKDLA